jgi:hypothetical protein
MIITRKAIAGFILLAVIVFLSTQYTVNQMATIPQSKTSAPAINKDLTPDYLTKQTPKMEYRTPIMNWGSNAPIIVTAIIEVFTLCCYLGLKHIEPLVNRKAKEFVDRIR